MPQQHSLSRDQVIWSFGPDLQPVLEVEPGDVVTFETNDCFTGQIRSEADLVTGIDMSRINSATGPVAVKGAEPGDSLVAEILDVRPIEWGVATLIPGFGQLIEQVQAPLTRLFEVKDGMIRQNDRIAFPARPMVGVVGVATDGQTLSNGLAGRHGGNLDDHLHGKGAKIFFPVRQPGGMFAVGDMHASMGDGEICFTGVEIAGEVDIRFDVLKGKQATWPVTELSDRWLPHATAPQFADALQLVSEEAARMLVDEHGFSLEDAFIFLSVACDAGVAQACKPCEGFGTIARFSIPKIDACPAPFKGLTAARTIRDMARTMHAVHESTACGVAASAEIIGAKWTALLVHDLSEGPRRFSQLERSCCGISPRTLAERLRALEHEGIVDRRSYPESPPRVEYELTEKGEALLPIIDAMREFGHAHLHCDHHDHAH
jgi:amidase